MAETGAPVGAPTKGLVHIAPHGWEPVRGETRERANNALGSVDVRPPGLGPKRLQDDLAIRLERRSSMLECIPAPCHRLQDHLAISLERRSSMHECIPVH